MQNCRIKEPSIKLEVRKRNLTSKMNFFRMLVYAHLKTKAVLRIPKGVRTFKLSDHINEDFIDAEGNIITRQLNKNIVIEMLSYEGKRTIKVKTEIEPRFLSNI